MTGGPLAPTTASPHRATATHPATMAAAIHRRYGPPEELEIARLPVATPAAGQVLVRIAAAALNPADVFLMLGRPAPVRLMTGLRRPSAKRQVRGQDLAGTVEAVGAAVTELKVGDRVFGSADGSLAEYACASEASLAVMPARLSFEQAAAIPMAGLAALHGLRDAARLAAGQHLLVNGASGGIGTFAIQIAKALGAEVTAVCSGANAALVRELGADHVIDYTVRPLTEVADRYDVILDNVANHALGAMRRLLTPTGTLLTNSGEVGPDGGPLVRILKTVGHSLRGKQTVKTFLSSPNRDDLAALASMADTGAITPVIDRRYRLDQAVEAMTRVASRRARGKVVVVVAPVGEALGG